VRIASANLASLRPASPDVAIFAGSLFYVAKLPLAESPLGLNFMTGSRS
jgi:hypothetical protein